MKKIRLYLESSLFHFSVITKTSNILAWLTLAATGLLFISRFLYNYTNKMRNAEESIVWIIVPLACYALWMLLYVFLSKLWIPQSWFSKKELTEDEDYYLLIFFIIGVLMIIYSWIECFYSFQIGIAIVIGIAITALYVLVFYGSMEIGETIANKFLFSRQFLSQQKEIEDEMAIAGT